MESDKLYNDADLAQFYDLENGWGDDMDFCLALARDAASVLDLGCGTGLLTAEIARTGTRAVGVDPALPMLEIARGRPGGGVRWIEADARSVRLDETFDLIVLTGHAFQVFLTPEDRLAVLRTIAVHLAPGGCFVFDSRNPAVEKWREWTPSVSRRIIGHPVHGPVEAWYDARRDPDTRIVTYDTFYRIVATGRVLSARSRLDFPSGTEIARLARSAGLEVDRWMGDWNGAACGRKAPEIIPVGRLSRTTARHG